MVIARRAITIHLKTPYVFFHLFSSPTHLSIPHPPPYAPYWKTCRSRAPTSNLSSPTNRSTDARARKLISNSQPTFGAVSGHRAQWSRSMAVLARKTCGSSFGSATYIPPMRKTIMLRAFTPLIHTKSIEIDSRLRIEISTPYVESHRTHARDTRIYHAQAETIMIKVENRDE